MKLNVSDIVESYKETSLLICETQLHKTCHLVLYSVGAHL